MSEESRLGIYNMTDGTSIRTMDTGSRITASAWSPDGDNLAIANGEGEIIVLGRGLNEVSRIVTDHHSVIESLSWQGRVIASISLDRREVKTWIVHGEGGQIFSGSVFTGWGCGVGKVQWYPDESRVLALHFSNEPHLTGGNSIVCYSESGEECFRVTPNQGWFQDADLSPGGELIATASREAVTLRSGIDGSLIERLNTSTATRCRWNPVKPRELALITGKGVEIWSLEGSENLPKETLQVQNPIAIEWSGRGDLLAVGTSSGVEVWDPARPLLLAFAQTCGRVLDTAFSPDTSKLAAISRLDKPLTHFDTPPACKKWNSLAGVTVWSVVKHLDRGSATIDILSQMVLPKMPWETESMSWSPNSTLLAIGKGTPERGPTGEENCPHQPGVILVQTNPQGTLAITHNLTGPSRPTSSVDFSPGNMVIAGSNDGTIMAWTAIIPQTTLHSLLTALITLLILTQEPRKR